MEGNETFSAKLISARRAKNMTQEQLAAAIGMTRQGVSNWERDRTIPDLEGLRKLTEVLDCDFFEAAGLKNSDSSELPKDEAPQEPIRKACAQAEPNAAEQPRPVESVPTVKRSFSLRALTLTFLSGVALALVIALLIVPLFKTKTQSFQPFRDPTGKDTQENISRFRAAGVPIPGKPFVYISFSENPCLLEENGEFPDGVGWVYTAYLTEYNGCPFHMTSYTQYLFTSETEATRWKYTTEDFNSWWGDSEIAARGQKVIPSGMPWQDMVGVGIKVTGTDENGEELTFYGFMDLSQELRDTEIH